MPHTVLPPLLYQVNCGQSGERLDCFLQKTLENCSLRGARKLIDQGLVQVNGRHKSALYRLRGTERIEIATQCAVSCPSTMATTATGPEQPLKLLLLTAEYAVFSKPAGLHSAAVAGSRSESVEAILHARWQTLCHDWMPTQRTHPATPPPRFPQVGGAVWQRCIDFLPAPNVPVQGELRPELCTETPRLLTRLDYATSGIMTAALTPGGEADFRQLEENGLCHKYYLAVLEGRLTQTLHLEARLDTCKRRVTKVLQEKNPDPTRHTQVTPIADAEAVFEAGTFPVSGAGAAHGATLALVRIQRGARHQIRAHLAAAGHPLCGDSLYGGSSSLGISDSSSGRENAFYLHHCGVQMGELCVHCPPPWLG